jgi:hypothetical protein
LAARAGAVSYIYQTAATAKRQKFAHATATDNFTINFNNSGNTTITSAAGNDAKAAVATYLKYAGLPNPGFTFIPAASIALTSQVKEWIQAAGDPKGGLLIGAQGVSVIGNETTNYLEIGLGSSSITAGVGLAKWEVFKQKITTAESTAQTSIVDTPLLYLNEHAFPMRRWGELPTVLAPTSSTVYFTAVG